MERTFKTRCQCVALGDSPAHDAELLQRFVSGRAEDTFADIVKIHGPMVLRTVRRILGDIHAAEDAFQATFTVLFQKPGAIPAGATLGGWLHGIADRVARGMKRSAETRRSKERQGQYLRPTEQPSEGPSDVLPLIHDEIGRLPTKFRLPVVLSYLEGMTYEEGARELGWPSGTFATNLAQARKQLRHRLSRRGITLTSAALVVALRGMPVAAAVPPALIHTTLQAVRGKTVTLLGGGCFKSVKPILSRLYNGYVACIVGIIVGVLLSPQEAQSTAPDALPRVEIVELGHSSLCDNQASLQRVTYVGVLNKNCILLGVNDEIVFFRTDRPVVHRQDLKEQTVYLRHSDTSGRPIRTQLCLPPRTGDLVIQAESPRAPTS